MGLAEEEESSSEESDEDQASRMARRRKRRVEARKLKKSYEPYLLEFTLVLGGLPVTHLKTHDEKEEEAAALPGLVTSAVAAKLGVDEDHLVVKAVAQGSDGSPRGEEEQSQPQQDQEAGSESEKAEIVVSAGDEGSESTTEGNGRENGTGTAT